MKVKLFQELHEYIMSKGKKMLIMNNFSFCRPPVAQLVTMQAVNPGVVSSNLSSANIFSDDWQKSLWQASFVFHQWANSLCGKAGGCLVSMLCQLLEKYVVWCTGLRKPGNMSRWTCRCDMTEFFWKQQYTSINPSNIVCCRCIKMCLDMSIG